MGKIGSSRVEIFNNDFEDKSVKYTWTPTGANESITYPDDSVARYQYDQAGRITQVTDQMNKTTAYR